MNDSNYTKNLGYLLLISFLILSIFDIGNLDALRQGTEGFYLLISNEMYNDGYILTPRLVNDNHWSKPPFHFWLPMPVQLLLKGSYLTSARLSILLLTFGVLILIAKWNKKYFNISFLGTFFFFTSSFSILKYSRIYMMEAPFSLLIFFSLLTFYLYSMTLENKFLITSIIATACSILVKGPVSLAIISLCIGAYYFPSLISKVKLDVEFKFNKIIIWFLTSSLLGSLWFIYCYIVYGNEFYEYFFIRENLGKFSSKSYPISSVINGLFIYSFPLIVFFPRSFNKFLKTKDSLGFFLFISFIISFLIWFIPNQKSHHYAVPATIPLIFFILRYFDFKETFKIERRIIIFISVLMTFILFIAGLFTISLEIPFFESPSLLKILIILTIIMALLVYKIITNNRTHYFYCLSTFYSVIWILFLPIFLLPTVPSEVINLTDNKNVSVVFRKPYFIQEGLGKEIEIFGHDTIAKKIENSNDLYIVPLDVYHSQHLYINTKIIHQWPLWKRGLKPKTIFDSIMKNKPKNLVQYLVLLKKQQ